MAFFGPQALHGDELIQVDGQLLPEFFVILDFAGVEILLDLLGDAFADAGDGLQGLEAAVLVDSLDAVLEILQGDGGLLVGIGLEADAVHFQILGQLIKDFGNFPVFHGIDF